MTQIDPVIASKEEILDALFERFKDIIRAFPMNVIWMRKIVLRDNSVFPIAPTRRFGSLMSSANGRCQTNGLATRSFLKRNSMATRLME